MAIFLNETIGQVTKWMNSLKNEDMDGGLLNYMMQLIITNRNATITEKHYFQWLAALLTSPVAVNDPDRATDMEYSNPNPYNKCFILIMIFVLFLPVLIYVTIGIFWIYIGENELRSLNFKVLLGSTKRKFNACGKGLLQFKIFRKLRNSIRRFISNLYFKLYPNSKVMPLDNMQSCIHSKVTINLLINWIAINLTIFLSLTILFVFWYNVYTAENLAPSSNNNSVAFTVSKSIDTLLRYVQEDLVKENWNIWNLQAEKMKIQLKNDLNSTINTFISTIMNETGISQSIKQTQFLADQFNAILESVVFIDNRLEKISSDYNAFKGRYQYLQEQLLKLFDSICPKLSTSVEESICLKYKNEFSQIKALINFDKIDLDSIRSLLSFLGNRNLTELTGELMSASSLFDNEIANVYPQISKNFNLDEIFDGISGIWTTFDEILQTEHLKNGTENVKYRLNESITSFYIYFVALSVVMVCIIYTIWIYCALLFTVLVRYFLNVDRQKNKSEHLSLHLQEAKCVKLSYLKIHSLKWKTCLVICGIAIFFPSVYGALWFLIGSSTETEICRYLTDENGIKVLDRKVNLVIDDLWLTLEFPDSIGPVVNVPKPHNLVSALLVNCKSSVRQPSPRLLTGMNLSSVININVLLSGPEITKAIERGQTEVDAVINSLADKNKFPDLESIRKDVQFITETLDSENYDVALNELHNPVLSHDNYEEFINNMHTIIMAFLEEYPSDSNLKFALDFSKYLLSDLTKYHDLISRKSQFKKYYQILQDNRLLTVYAIEFFNLYDNMKNNLLDSQFMKQLSQRIYEDAIKDLKYKLHMNLETTIIQLQEELLPCSVFEENINDILVQICGESGLTKYLTAYGITWLFSLLVAHIFLLSLTFLMHLSKYFMLERHISTT